MDLFTFDIRRAAHLHVKGWRGVGRRASTPTTPPSPSLTPPQPRQEILPVAQSLQVSTYLLGFVHNFNWGVWGGNNRGDLELLWGGGDVALHRLSMVVCGTFNATARHFNITLRHYCLIIYPLAFLQMKMTCTFIARARARTHGRTSKHPSLTWTDAANQLMNSATVRQQAREKVETDDVTEALGASGNILTSSQK